MQDANLMRVTNEVNSLMVKKGSLEKSYVALDNEVNALKKELDSINRTIEEKKEKSVSLNNQILDLEKSVQESKRTIEGTKAEMAKIAEEAQAKRDREAVEFGHVRSAINKQMDIVHQRESKLDAWEKNLNTKSAQVADLDAELKGKQKKLNEQLEHSEKLRSDSERLRTDALSMNEGAAVKFKEASAQMAKARQFEDSMSARKKELDAILIDIEHFNRKKASIQEEITDAWEKYSESFKTFKERERKVNEFADLILRLAAKEFVSRELGPEQLKKMSVIETYWRDNGTGR